MEKKLTRVEGQGLLNDISVDPMGYLELLEKFPEAYQEKLRIYTAEELFYVYKLLTFKARYSKAGDINGSDVTVLALKAKCIRWLKGQEKHPISPTIWLKLGKRWRFSFEEFAGVEALADEVA